MADQPALDVRVRRLAHGRDLALPTAASPASAGLDLRAAVEADLVLEPGARTVVPTGLVLELPAGCEGQVRPRSGLALRHGVTVLNSPGTIDPDYRGEVQVLLVNLGQEAFVIRRGERIAQLVVARFERLAWVEVDSVAASERGSGGFGSTGTS
ncbi:MAG TPA: dUTP diphosphatase [Vicinamibacterales bacterium]|nr:dUTP diphosphatase [Vicinamibacterales bacterium]